MADTNQIHNLSINSSYELFVNLGVKESMLHHIMKYYMTSDDLEIRSKGFAFSCTFFLSGFSSLHKKNLSKIFKFFDPNFLCDFEGIVKSFSERYFGVQHVHPQGTFVGFPF